MAQRSPSQRRTGGWAAGGLPLLILPASADAESHIRGPPASHEKANPQMQQHLQAPEGCLQSVTHLRSKRLPALSLLALQVTHTLTI